MPILNNITSVSFFTKEGNHMDLNGINYTTPNVANKTSSSNEKSNATKDSKKSESTEKDKAVDTGVVYKKSDSSSTVTGLYTPNTALVNQMKADSETRLTQLQDLVNKLISKQGNAAKDAEDIWSLLQKGDIKVDQETADAAKEAISEDGYWGVNQTSDRIISFAKALTGGDPSKIDAMQEAFKKGYDEATKAWGKDLPEISSKTYDAVMEKFDAWRNESGTKDATSPTTPTTNTVATDGNA
jgi:hypothetical protein